MFSRIKTNTLNLWILANFVSVTVTKIISSRVTCKYKYVNVTQNEKYLLLHMVINNFTFTNTTQMENILG